jgi:hypothetical protein
MVIVDYINIMSIEKGYEITNMLYLKGKHLAEGLRRIADKYECEPRGLKDSGRMIAWVKFNPYSRNPFGPKRSALEMLKPRTFQLNNRGF